MLYLAEVKTQNKGFVGGYKTELKLLASQAQDQTWNAIAGEDIVATDIIKDQSSKGALYILNLDNNKQISGEPELAGPRVVNYLRHFSRTLEKSKSQEQEIEEWKTSLAIQGEEIAKRQAELDLQQQVLQEQETKLAELEEEKNKLTTAWEQVRAEQQRLSENKLDQGEIRDKLTGILTTFTDNITNPQNLSNNCTQVLEAVNNQQTKLDEYWNQLEYSKSNLEEQRQELESQKHNFKQHREELLAEREELAKKQLQLELMQNRIGEKENLLKQFNFSKEGIERLQQEIYLLGQDGEEQQVDINELESMPLGDLEKKVNEVKEETAKVVNFVNMQEEELTLQADEVKEIQNKMAEASEVDKLGLENELSDAQEAMKLLNETLVGQRRNLKKQQKMLNEYLKVFSRRKGIIDLDFAETINVKPLLSEVDIQKKDIEKSIENLNQELNNLRQSSQQYEQEFNSQQEQYSHQETQLNNDEENLQQFCSRVTEMQTAINLLEGLLQPIQEQLNNIRSQADGIQNEIHQISGGFDAQNGAINELQSMLSD